MAQADYGTFGGASSGYDWSQEASKNGSHAGGAYAPDPRLASSLQGESGAYDYADEEFDAGQTPLSKAAGAIGGFVSLALLIGICVWGYQILMRDVTGVPVVEALDGPMRVAPADPGGQAAAHQGLSVNAVAEAGADEAPVEQVVLAPGGTDVLDGDAPADLTAAPRVDAAPASAPLTLTPLRPDGEIDVLALADQLAAQVAATTPETPVLESAVEAPISAPVDLAAAVEDAVATAAETPTQWRLTRSIRPQLRRVSAVVPVAAEPAVVSDLAAATNAAVEAALQPSAPRPALRPDGLSERPVSAPATLDIAASEVPLGSRLVQLGAYDSADVARAEWDRLAVRYEDYLVGKRRLVQEATSGGRTFFRLRAVGFADLADSRRFCSALVAQGTACIPVEAK